MPSDPHFFVDRSLGRKQVPTLLRDAGWSLTTLAEHYGIPADESVSDVEWLALAWERGWAVLLKDDRIRRRPAEIGALAAAGLHAFCIANAGLTAGEQVRMFLDHQQAIFGRCTEEGPTFDTVSKAGMRPAQF